MSDLTDFFPSTGGSSDITDPKMLPRIATAPSSIWLRMYLNQSRNDVDVLYFWPSYASPALSEQFSTLQLSATFNTYETVLDISSSPNGGYLHNILGSYINPSQTQTFKITVDGVATEITQDNPSTGQAVRGCLGWLSPGAAVRGSGGTALITPDNRGGSMGENNYFSVITDQFQPTNAYYANISNGFIFGQSTEYTIPVSPWAYPSLKFEETLKVEIKRSGRYTSSAAYEKTGVRHSLL
tara:strand:- start:279 stop:998 length:720 start_codon:yes stop_codon:yes gene_type:complete